MKLTKTQEKLVDRIKSNSKGWEITDQETWGKGTLYLKVERFKDQFYNREICQLTIGTKGKVEFFGADRVFADKEHARVIASLCGYDLFNHTCSVKIR